MLDAYGPGLREALDAQRKKHGGSLPIGEAVRLHPGKLHCNYLLWVASRGPERDAQQADAPKLDVIERIVETCLGIAGANGSISIGFGPLGEGPQAAPPEQRLAAIVRAAHRYQESAFASGRPTHIEVVRVCDLRGGVTASARRLVGKLAQSAPEPTSAARSETSERTPRREARPKAPSASGSRRRPEQLDAADVAARRVSANPYDRARRYAEAEWFVHPRFGVGQVKRVTPDGAIEVLFEDGSTKKMLHAQSG